jgi:hypothetical protein
VFSKHPLRPKKSFTKGCSNKQSLKYLTQNKTKWVDPKTLVQPWTEPKTKVWPENNPKQRFKLIQKQSWKLTQNIKEITEK